MTPAFMQYLPIGFALFVLQGLAAIPWIMLLTRKSVRRDLAFFVKVVGSAGIVGVLFAFILESNSDPSVVTLWGQFYGSILTLQVGIDLFIGTYYVLLIVWPKGGAVALAAFQESVRQPMFWLLTIMGTLFMGISIVIPYFTFGGMEELKLLKEITYAITMILPAIFGVISASISVSEEIEGRTAVTLLSKPITRRDFLFGKFLGITLAGAFMTMLMGWVLIWVVLAKFNYEFQVGITPLVPDPEWLTKLLENSYAQTISGDMLKGIGLWFRDVGEALPGLSIGFGQVMTLVAVSVALATRVPMVVNITMCLLIYFLGHLAPIMTEVSMRLPLVHFVAQLFELLLPGLAVFDVSNAIVRDVPLDSDQYTRYTLNVALYATMYTIIALLAGLILFEDRDVA